MSNRKHIHAHASGVKHLHQVQHSTYSPFTTAHVDHPPTHPPTHDLLLSLVCRGLGTLSTFEGGVEGFTVAFSAGALGSQEKRSVRNRSDPVWAEAEGAVLAAARPYQQVNMRARVRAPTVCVHQWPRPAVRPLAFSHDMLRICVSFY